MLSIRMAGVRRSEGQREFNISYYPSAVLQADLQATVRVVEWGQSKV